MSRAPGAMAGCPTRVLFGPHAHHVYSPGQAVSRKCKGCSKCHSRSLGKQRESYMQDALYVATVPATDYVMNRLRKSLAMSPRVCSRGVYSTPRMAAHLDPSQATSFCAIAS